MIGDFTTNSIIENQFEFKSDVLFYIHRLIDGQSNKRILNEFKEFQNV